MPRQAEEVLQYEDFLGGTVSSLKDFLSLRGLKQTGRKPELVARAFGAYELKAPVKFSQEQIYKQIKEEYSRRLSSNGIKTDPNTIPHDAWIDDVKQWPEVDDGKLLSYILRTKAVDVEYIGKYKDQKAYSYWMTGFVDTVLFTKCPIDSKQFDPRKPQDRQLTNERVSSLINGIIQNIPSACVLYSIEHKKDDGLPELLPQKALSFMSSEEMKGKPLEYTAQLFLKECQMTADQVKRVEIETRGQSTNDLWHQQRIGRVTASNFHTYHTKAQSILNRKGQNVKKPVYSSLVSSLLSKSGDGSHLPQIKWGTAHEKDAIKAFMSDVASQHDGSLQGFKQCGLFIKPDYPCLTASPDGLFLCKCCGLSIVEAKCPYTVRNEHIHVRDTFDRVDFLEDFHGKHRLKRSHKYYTQIQAQMWVCGVCHGFFIVWTQGSPPYYERVELDMEFCLNVVNNITLFYKSFVLPCLLGYRDIFDCPKCNKVILKEDEIGDSTKENSICCDTCGTWWHLPRADLTMSTADALDSWVCQSCLADVVNAIDSDDVLEFNFAQ